MPRQKSVTGTPVPARPPPADERRHYHSARDAFEYAYSLVEPFLHPETGWQGRSLHHVSFSLVCENFPELAHDEVHVLLAAVKRAFDERNPGVAALTS